MLIQRLLQLLGLAIVLMAAVAVLALVLRLAGWLLHLAAWVFVVLVCAAAVLRFIELVRTKQRGRI